MKQRHELTCSECKVRQTFVLRQDVDYQIFYVFEGEKCHHWLYLWKDKRRRQKQLEKMQDAQGYWRN